MLPPRVQRRFTVDPLIGIGSAMSERKPGETTLLQVLFQPAHDPWSESILQAVLDEPRHRSSSMDPR
jgi:hypothetical protein